MPKKKKRSQKPASPGGLSASDFVRSQPVNTKAGDVVRAGAEQGLNFSKNLVYAVRATARRKAGGGPSLRGPRGRGARRVLGGGGTETDFRRLVLELGVGRARQLLDEVEDAVTRLIAG